ncbi:hypothetical protein DRN44_06110, partial [Thermococci archaeon]
TIVAGCIGGETQQETTPASNQTPGETHEEKILVVAIPEEIQGTDIQQVTWSNIVHDLIFQSLVVYTLDLKGVVPNLAENFEVSPNGTEITFKLPTDAKFSNGDPVTAEDIKNSILRYREISPYAEDFAVVKDIIVKDEHTVTLVLESPAPYLWGVLASTYAAPVNVKVAEKVGMDEFNRKAVGSGPFMVEEWVQGLHIVLVKNPYYKTNIPFVKNKGPFKIDKVIVRFIPEDFTRISELEAGNVHIVVDVPVENVETLKNNPDIQLLQYLQPGVDYILINTNKPPLDDVRVRKAIALAINREELKVALDNLVRPAYGYLSPAQVGYHEETEKELQQEYSYNLEEAKKLLAEAGWEDKDGDGIVEKDGEPLSLTLLVPLDAPMLKKDAPIIQAQLKKLGIDLKLREYESSYIRELTEEEGNFELAMRYYWWNDADIMIYIYHSSAGYPWSNPEVDKLLEEARTITDFGKRAEKYGEIQKLIAKEMPAIPLFSEYQYVAVRKEVKGIAVGVDGAMYLNDVGIES